MFSSRTRWSSRHVTHTLGVAIAVTIVVTIDVAVVEAGVVARRCGPHGGGPRP